MSIKIVVDDAGILKALTEARLTEQDMLEIEGVPARIIINKQRDLIPRDTSASANSVNSHITESSNIKVVDEIGPELHYDPYLEWGTGIYAEKGNGRKGGWAYKDAKGMWHFTMGMRSRPFVRPSVHSQANAIIKSVANAFWEVIKSKWPT